MKTSQQGITLLESLVALMVLSIGLLGTAHLMATGIKQSNNSFARTQATYLAENIAERMRANPEAIANMNYDGFDSSNVDCATTVTSCEGSSPASCTFAQLATFDTFQASCGQGGSAMGSNGVKALLTNGQLTIACNDAVCTDRSTYTIQASWSETELKSDNTDETKVKSVQHVILP